MSKCDWSLHRRLKAEGRLNLLFRLSEPCASSLPNDRPSARPNVVPFISRSEHLAWREQWKQGRWVRLSWSDEERAAILRQDEIFREADRKWEERHPKPTAPARVLFFPPPTGYDFGFEAARRAGVFDPEETT